MACRRGLLRRLRCDESGTSRRPLSDKTQVRRPHTRLRPDVIATTPSSGGVANTGADEANHFMQMAGAFMRPGYLPPVGNGPPPATR